MGLNLNFLGGVYRGAQDELARQANEERLKARDEREAKQAERMDQEAEFAEETRGRQRKAWTKQDQIEANEKKYRAEFEAQNQSGPVGIAPVALTSTAPEKSLQSDENQSEAETKRLLSKVPTGLPASPATSTQSPAKVPTAATIPAVNAPASGAAAPQEQKASNQSSESTLPAPEKATAASLPGGVARPRANFNNALALQQYVLDRKLAAGEVDSTTYTQHLRNIQSFKDEGGERALRLFNQGRNEEALEEWNRSGQMAGAKLISSKMGTTKIRGEELPTNFVVLQMPDGQVFEMNTRLAQDQLMPYEKVLADARNARQIKNQEDFHKDSLALSREQMQQQAKRDAASFGLQQQQLNMQRQHFDWQRKQYGDGTPLGKIRLLEEAKGAPLTDDERANMLGLSNMPKATQMRIQSLLKEHEELAKQVAAAQVNNSFVAADKDGKPNPALVRMSLISQQINDLSSGGKDPFSDIKTKLGTNGGAKESANAAGSGGAKRAVSASEPVFPEIGGIRPPRYASIKNDSMTQTLAREAIDEKLDSVLSSIRPGMTRQEKSEVFGWLDKNTDYMTPAQLKQVRDAKMKAGIY